MRLYSLEISGFRGFGGSERFDLDADAVILSGSNGQGKTSFFDAILWALTGVIPRLGPDASIVSMYSQSGEARVALDIVNATGSHVTIVRNSDGAKSRLLLDAGNKKFRGTDAEAQLLRLVWPQSLSAAEPERALMSAVERSVYLQQDRVRDFIEADTDQDRFTAISELVGAGRVTELQMALERSRTAWSKATNVRIAETDLLRQRIQLLKARLQSLASVYQTQPIEPGAWQRWWAAATALGVVIDQVPEIDSGDAPKALDTAAKQLQALQSANDRKLDAARGALLDLEALPPPGIDDLVEIHAALQASVEAAEESRKALVKAERQSAAARRRQRKLFEEGEQSRAFAELALLHLGERCPVCQQTYDEMATRRRLEKLALQTRGIAEGVEEVPDISGLAELLEEREQAVSSAAERLRRAEEAARNRKLGLDRLTRLLEQFGLASESQKDWRVLLSELARHLEQQSFLLAKHLEDGEDLALAHARAGEHARRAEVEREVGELNRELEGMDADIRARQRTAKLVEETLGALRSAISDVVGAHLNEIEPLLQRIYATADPHPAFRVVRLLTSMSRGRGGVTPVVQDPAFNILSDSPETTLSSSQLNVLAVSVFLALNLAFASLPLRTAILDDPLQSLDDLNLLGLIDLLRRTRERRQLLISTHDARFVELLERKLRPVAEGQRTLVLELNGWGRDGPVTNKRELPREPATLRIAG